MFESMLRSFSSLYGTVWYGMVWYGIVEFNVPCTRHSIGHFTVNQSHTHVRLLDERLTDRNLNNDTARPNVSFKMQL